MVLDTHPHKTIKKCVHSIVGVDSTPLSSHTIKRIEEAENDLLEGNVLTLKEIKDEYGLE
jgi:hypothetical protein